MFDRAWIHDVLSDHHHLIRCIDHVPPLSFRSWPSSTNEWQKCIVILINAWRQLRCPRVREKSWKSDIFSSSWKYHGILILGSWKIKYFGKSHGNVMKFWFDLVFSLYLDGMISNLISTFHIGKFIITFIYRVSQGRKTEGHFRIYFGFTPYKISKLKFILLCRNPLIFTLLITQQTWIHTWKFSFWPWKSHGISFT